MKRRRFLLLSGGGLLLAGTGGWLWRAANTPEPATAGVHLEHLAEAMSGAAVIGRAWLDANADRDPKADLVERLAFDPQVDIENHDFVERLSGRIERDLAGEQIFVHEGWWLSETEAQLAALHVVVLGKKASKPSEPGFEHSREGRLVRILDQNPTSATRGEPLSHSGLPDNVISFRTSRRPPNRLVFVVKGHRRPISARPNGFSVLLPDAVRAAIASSAGDEVDLWLYDPVAQRRQRIGALEIREPTANDEGFCAPTDWGDRSTRAGEVFNEQPDGSAAFWVRVSCFPRRTVVVLNDVELPTTLRTDEGLITARVPDPTLYATAGRYTLELLDRDSGTTEPVGEFVVED